MTPSRYAQHVKHCLTVFAKTDAVDMDLKHLDKDPRLNVLLFGGIPYGISAKYHRCLREIFIMSYLNALFKYMSCQLTLAEKHNIVTQALCRIGSVRESAGR